MYKLLFILIFLFCISCDSNDIQTYRVSKSQVNKKMPESSIVSKNNIKWDIPKGWSKSSGSKMRLASFNVPFSAGYGDLSVIILANDGGGIEANINRWRGQISLNPETLSQINRKSKIRKNEFGDYQIFEVVNEENRDKAFICAIIPSNDTTIFVKLSMSADGINEIIDDFLFFCDSFKLKNE